MSGWGTAEGTGPGGPFPCKQLTCLLEGSVGKSMEESKQLVVFKIQAPETESETSDGMVFEEKGVWILWLFLWR